MKVDTAVYTSGGGHEINEDSYLVREDVYAVADGLGGHEQGEEASACAIRCMEEECRGNYGEQRIFEILEAANKAVYDLNSPARTTIAAAFVEQDIFFYGNVGDSRVYYFRDDRVFAQSKDHSVCQAAVDMGTMQAEEIRGSDDRSKLFKVLGDREELKLKKPYPSIAMQPGDAFLVCSDGFWEYVYELEMEMDLLKSDCAKDWMYFMLKRQILRAENKGDNYTVICGMISEENEKSQRKKGPKIGLLRRLLR